MRTFIATASELAGLGLIVAAAWQLSTVLGLAVGGVVLVLVGVVVDPPSR